MTTTIAVINHKGGVGKTTTAVNLAAGMSREGRSVLLVDLDPQGNATYGLGTSFIAGESQTIADVLGEAGVHVRDVIVDTQQENLKLVPADIRLANTAVQLISMMFRESRLKKSLEDVHGFDYVVIDAQPSLDVLPINAIYSADKILVPTELTGHALCGLSDLMGSMRRTKNGSSFDWRILLTKVTGHGEERQGHGMKYLEPFLDRILTTSIRNTEAIPRSQMEGSHTDPLPVVLQKQWSRGAKDYRALTREIIDLWPV